MPIHASRLTVHTPPLLVHLLVPERVPWNLVVLADLHPLSAAPAAWIQPYSLGSPSRAAATDSRSLLSADVWFWILGRCLESAGGWVISFL